MGTVFGVIYPPLVALVGLGKIVEKPWVEKGMLGGAPCAHAFRRSPRERRPPGLFLAALDRLLQAPEKR